MRAGTLVAVVVGLVCGSPCSTAQVGPGFDWVTVGVPGNRGATAEEMPQTDGFFPPVGIGSVDYEYRIMRSQVSGSLWVEFANAWAGHLGGEFDFDGDLSATLLSASRQPDGSWGLPYRLFVPEAATWAINTSLLYSMRYANWLHNGKVNEAWAFADGAYDLSSVVFDPNGHVIDDSVERSPDAKYWIPSLDEMTKAFYHDPDRYGPGEEGYWLFPDQGNDPLIEDAPGIGETPVRDSNLIGQLGLYPDVQSAWGVIDVSGVWDQWTDTVLSEFTRDRYHVGSTNGGAAFLFDRIDWIGTGGMNSTGGLRLASFVPSPTPIPLAILAFWIRPRRARCSRRRT